MVYIFGLVISCLIVGGQVLWKLGLEKSNFIFSLKSVFSWDFVNILMNPYIIIGVIFYAVATVAFMTSLAKFEYTNLQAIVVSSSLLFTFVAAFLIFGEKISLINLLGLGCLLIGVLLVTKF